MHISKEVIREKFPHLIALRRRMIRALEYHRSMRQNRYYKKAIETIRDPAVLKSRLDELSAKNVPHTHYVVSCPNSALGIYGFMNTFLPHIAFAIARGYIPVMDMKTFPNIYQAGGENSWESFYEQPFGVGLDDMHGKVVQCPSTLYYRWEPNSCPLMSDEDVALWSAVYSAAVRCHGAAKQYIESELASVLPDPEKTVGVIYRGTDYTKGRMKGHPIQPTMEQLSQKVREVMERQGCEWVYIASDEKSIVDYLRERFPGRVLINKRIYYDELDIDYTKVNETNIGVNAAKIMRENDEFLRGVEYISSMNIVANCGCLVAGACGGTTAALYMNGLKYREKYIFDLGKYGAETELEGKTC